MKRKAASLWISDLERKGHDLEKRLKREGHLERKEDL